MPADRIRTERFTVTCPPAPTRWAPAPRGCCPAQAEKDIALTVVLDGKGARARHRPRRTRAGRGLNAGLDLPFSCKAGVCCTCRAKVLDGTVVMDKNFTLEAPEVAQGFVLSRQARATSKRLLVSLTSAEPPGPGARKATRPPRRGGLCALCGASRARWWCSLNGSAGSGPSALGAGATVLDRPVGQASKCAATISRAAEICCCSSGGVGQGRVGQRCGAPARAVAPEGLGLLVVHLRQPHAGLRRGCGQGSAKPP